MSPASALSGAPLLVWLLSALAVLVIGVVIYGLIQMSVRRENRAWKEYERENGSDDH